MIVKRAFLAHLFVCVSFETSIGLFGRMKSRKIWRFS